MQEKLAEVLRCDKRIAYGILFGSAARGSKTAHGDLDIAVELAAGESMTALELGALVSRLEQASGETVDLVRLEEAPPGLAFRIFRDGVSLHVADREAYVARKARAILDYLDFKPVEELCARGVLEAARRGR